MAVIQRMPERNDEDLMLATGQGDNSAFAVLAECHHRSVVQFIYRFLGNSDRETAEDLAQDVFSAFKAAGSYQPRAKVITWLLRMAKNAALNYRRGQRLRRTETLRADDSSPTAAGGARSVEAGAMADEEAARIRRAVAALPASQRAAIILRHFHDFTYSDIADVLEVSISAVESLLFRARCKLRGMLLETRTNQDAPQVSPDLGAGLFREDTVL